MPVGILAPAAFPDWCQSAEAMLSALQTAESILQLYEYARAGGGLELALKMADRGVDKRFLIGPTADVVTVARHIRKHCPDFGVVLNLGHLPLLAEDPESAVRLAAPLLVRVDGPGELRRVARINATTCAAEVGSVDLAILAVKAFATEAGAATIRELLVTDGRAISMQNGLGNAERLAAVVPRARVAIGIPGHGGALLGPGHVAHRVAALTHLGWLNADRSDNLEHTAALLSEAGLEVPEARRLSELAIQEVVAVATANGVRLPWSHPVAACRAVYLANGEDHVSSMTVDVLRERPTEIDVLNGAVVEHGRRLGIATPINEGLTLSIKTIERTGARRVSLRPEVMPT